MSEMKPTPAKSPLRSNSSAMPADFRLGELFESRRESGRDGLPILSVTMNTGLVARGELDRKQDSSLVATDYLLVKPGDIAYNMMRMWQGASGLAVKEGMVSPAYVVLARRECATSTIDPQFAAYLFKSQRMVYLFWAYSYGLTSDRLRLYFEDLTKIPVRLPNMDRQKAVVATLQNLDRSLEILSRLIKNNLSTRRALIQKLVTGKVRAPGFSSPLRKQEFESICDLIKDKVQPASANANLPCIELEHIEAQTGRLIGSTGVASQASAKGAFQTNDLLFGKLRPYLRKYWLADSDGYCSSEIWVLRPKTKKCLPGYLQLICQSDRFAKACHAVAGSKMPRAEWSFVAQTPFLIPSLEEQKAAVEIVGACVREHDLLSRRRDALLKEKQALMQIFFGPESRKAA